MNFFSILCVQLLLILCCLQNIEGQYPLNEYISHHEGLSYDTEALHNQSLVKDKMLQLHFHSHGRDFDLRMQRDTGQFSPNLTVKVSGDLPMDIDYIDFIYTGQTFSENDTYTHAHGSVIDGRFEGYIKTDEGTYYVEPSERYFKERNVSEERNHSVIYHEDDIHYTYGGGCADQSAFTRMQMYKEEPVQEPLPKHQDLIRNWWGGVDTGPGTPKNEQTTCELLIQTDHHFFEYYGTRQKVMDQINNHVKSINSIYQRTDFNGIRNINFVVKTIIINTTSVANDESNPFRFPDMSHSDYLNVFSQANHDNYCLAYLFTSRTFEDVLGVAWEATVCNKHRWYYKDNKSFSLNSGVVTVNRVPPKVSHLTLAHEVGHNFGAPHDATAECTPGNQKGNYIMYPQSTGDDRPNNRKFSSCSIDAMSEFLKKNMNCFVKSSQPICGNGLVEKGEGCDCGYSDQCKDPCCYNADEDDDKRCKVKPDKECDPTSRPTTTVGQPLEDHSNSVTELLKTIAKWIVTNWWAVLLIGIALTVLMAAFITICKKRQGKASLFV